MRRLFQENVRRGFTSKTGSRFSELSQPMLLTSCSLFQRNTMEQCFGLRFEQMVGITRSKVIYCILAPVLACTMYSGIPSGKYFYILSVTFYLTYILTLYLAYIWHPATVAGLQRSIYAGILSGIQFVWQTFWRCSWRKCWHSIYCRIVWYFISLACVLSEFQYVCVCVCALSFSLRLSSGLDLQGLDRTWFFMKDTEKNRKKQKNTENNRNTQK